MKVEMATRTGGHLQLDQVGFQEGQRKREFIKGLELEAEATA